MKSKIIVVGAGHGGLVAAGKLAEKGFAVNVYEKSNRENLSWDWRDNISKQALFEIGLPEIDPSNYYRPSDFRFLSPDEKTKLKPPVPEEKREITIERRFLINYLTDFALNAGAQVHFNEKVLSPIISEGVVKGIKTENKEVIGDLVIDSSGVDSLIRPQLPESYKMDYILRRGELFHTYRAYYNKIDTKAEDQEYFEVCIGYKNKRGISWVNTSNEYADVLIGCVDPFQKGEIEGLVEDLRSKHPSIGGDLLRGGIIAPIPLRRPIPMMVGSNFALIGDAAWMPVPITGSGIVTAMLAGDILADTIINASETPTEGNSSYSIDQLWAYQYGCIHKFGADNGFINVIKNFLMTTPFENMNYLFHKKLITAEDIEAGRTGEGVRLTFLDILGRLVRSFPRIGIILDLGMQLRLGREVKNHMLKIPKQFNEQLVDQWIEKLENFFIPFYKKTEVESPTNNLTS